jgi:hypothetical protein
MGWEGDDCNTPSEVLVRRDFATLSDTDKQYVVDAFQLIKTTPHPWQPGVSMFDWMATGHYWSMGGTAHANTTIWPLLHGIGIATGHSGMGGPTFHRRMITDLDRLFRKALGNSSWVTPYWNFTGISGANDNDPVVKWFGGDGDSLSGEEGTYCRNQPTDNSVAAPVGCNCTVSRGPFANWTEIGEWGDIATPSLYRAFGCHVMGPSLPSQPATDWCVQAMYYCNDTSPLTSFRHLLGGGATASISNMASWPTVDVTSDLHRRTHRWIGGSMIGNYTASDPIFYMLHGFADLIMERWFRLADSEGRMGLENTWTTSPPNPSQGFFECQAPWYPLRQHSRFYSFSTTWGYDYDYFVNCPSCATQAMIRPPIPDESDTGLVLTPDTLELHKYDTRIFGSTLCANQSCCVVASNGFECGGESQGTCELVDDIAADSDKQATAWLTSWYSSVCVCKERFTGLDCNQCAGGWIGDDCSTPQSSLERQRQSFTSLPLEVQQKTVDGFAMLKYKPSPYQPNVTEYDRLAHMVSWSLTDGPWSSTAKSMVRGAFAGLGQLTFNRRMLLELENAMRRVLNDSTYALPYWDWMHGAANNNNNAIRLMGGDGEEKESTCRFFDRITGVDGCNCTMTQPPYFKWTEVGSWSDITETKIQRSFGCLPVANSLPDSTLLDHIMTITDVNEFWQFLSGHVRDQVYYSWPVSDRPTTMDVDMYTRVMWWIGGTTRGTSPASDPLWWLATNYADAIFEYWLSVHPEALSQFPATSNDGSIAPCMTANDMLPSLLPLQTHASLFVRTSELGYTVDMAVNGRATIDSSNSYSHKIDKKSGKSHVVVSSNYESSPSMTAHQRDIHERAQRAQEQIGARTAAFRQQWNMKKQLAKAQRIEQANKEKISKVSSTSTSSTTTTTTKVHHESNRKHQASGGKAHLSADST